MSFEVEIPMEVSYREIKVGDRTFNQYRTYKFTNTKGSIDTYAIKNMFGVTVKSGKPQDVNKEVCKIFGPKFHKRFPKMMFKAFIADVYPEWTWDSLKIKYNLFDPDLVNDLHYEKSQELYKQLERDNLQHILPAFTYTKKTYMSPKELRQEIGRPLWRRLVNSPKTKNLLVWGCRWDDKKEKLYDLTYHQLSFLRLSTQAFIKFEPNLVSKIKGRKSALDMRRDYQVIQDCERMLGRRFNPEWSLKRIKEEHDRETKRLNSLRYSDEQICEPHSFGNFTRLVTPLEIAQEGQEMRHCVSSYWRNVASGTYLVYKYENGKKRGTLGLNVDHNGYTELNQFYGHCNSRMDPESTEEARTLIREINKGTTK